MAGPPRSGKSCLREGLKQAIRAIPGAPYPYIITACPDGEGAWFQETVNHDAKLAAQCKANYKGKFTPEFVQRISDSVRDCTLELTLVDIGGIPSPENHQICASATHIVLLAGNDPKIGTAWSDRLPVWREFAAQLNLTIAAEIFSDYRGEEDSVEGVTDDVLHGSVHYLERGEPISGRPMIRALAQHLISL